jgi:hypothetical protein
MAEILENNASGLAVITRPAGVRRDSYSFQTIYDYTLKYKPEVIAELHYANGRGKISGMMALLGMEGDYASDQVKHAEMNRLHNRVDDASFTDVAGTATFTCATPHNAQVNMQVLISDGVKQGIGYVSAITSPTVFVAKNTELGVFGFTGSLVDITIDFSNSWNKGTGTFEQGNTWNPEFYENQSQIIKWRYDEAESDMANDIWFETPDGPRWTNTEIERTLTLFDNMIELTQFFGKEVKPGSPAALAGAPISMKGVVQIIEERGNVINGYLSTVSDLQDMALQMVEQGIDDDDYCILGDMEQMNKFNDLCAAVSPAAVNQYGSFPNGENMAIALDFSSIKVSGKTFYFKPWKVLNDVTILSGKRFDATGIGFIAFPMGTKKVKDETGQVSNSPYIKVLYRRQGDVNRKRKLEIFGHGGTPQIEDKMTLSCLCESTVQVIGANGLFVGGKTATTYGFDL